MLKKFDKDKFKVKEIKIYIKSRISNKKQEWNKKSNILLLSFKNIPFPKRVKLKIANNIRKVKNIIILIILNFNKFIITTKEKIKEQIIEAIIKKNKPNLITFFIL